MASICAGQANSPEMLDLYVADAGRRVDPAEAAIQVWDLTGASPVQVFPAGGGWAELVGGPGHDAEGHLWAYDAGAGAGWTPDPDGSIGRHSIAWRWKLAGDYSYRTAVEHFDVLTAGLSQFDSPALLADVRDAGIDEAAASDVAVIESIRTWESVVNRMCRQWFLPRRLTFRLDGSGNDVLFLPVPIVVVDSLKVNDDIAALAPSLYVIYAGTGGVQDHRRNPKLALKCDPGDIYTSWHGRRGEFLSGRQNQELSGVFGFVDGDNWAPPAVRRALVKLVIEKLRAAAPSGSVMPVPPVLGSVKSETTDGHRIDYGTAGSDVGSRRSGFTGVTQDPEIIDVLMMHRGPKAIAAPADWWR